MVTLKHVFKFNIETPLLSEIHNSLLDKLCLLIVFKLSMFPSKIELKPSLDVWYVSIEKSLRLIICNLLLPKAMNSSSSRWMTVLRISSFFNPFILIFFIKDSYSYNNKLPSDNNIAL